MPAETFAAPQMEMDAAHAAEILGQALATSSAEETEATLHSAISELTRFANNAIHQNVAEQQTVLSLRAVWQGRTARATTNRLDPEGIRGAAERALELAKLQAPDPELLPLLGRQAYRSVERAAAATAALSPAARAEVVREMVAIAEAAGMTAAGVMANSQSAYAMANSRGLEAFYQDTSAEFSVTMLAANSSGWAKGNSPDVRALDPATGARAACAKARDSANSAEWAPGQYTVILEPAAVLDLLGFLFWDFGGLAVLDQRSCLTGRLGTQLFGANIHVRDDVYHPLQSGAPFDGEGMPRERVVLVENGVVRSLVYARPTAARMEREQASLGARPTGHGFPLPNEYGEAPLNLVVDGGTASLEEMIASTRKGILVTRLWYIREVDPYRKLLTGMTRDGTFRIEDGKITGGVRNFRFNQSVIEMLQNVEELGPAVRASGEESFDMVVPAMKVRDFHFTEVTKF
ncbi:MAG: TldD/PmbA family protein [Terriglobales bacterium]